MTLNQGQHSSWLKVSVVTHVLCHTQVQHCHLLSPGHGQNMTVPLAGTTYHATGSDGVCSLNFVTLRTGFWQDFRVHVPRFSFILKVPWSHYVLKR